MLNETQPHHRTEGQLTSRPNITTTKKAEGKSKRKTLPCVECAGLGERDLENCTHRPRAANRNAIRAIWDTNGRWLVHWREKDGEEWVGTYRLIPC